MTDNTKLARLNWALLGLLPLGVLLATMIFNKAKTSDNLIGKDPSMKLAVVEAAQFDLTETDSKLKVANEDLNSNLSVFKMQELDQLSSPFTEKTVLKLNQIVKRSLVAVKAFDRIRRQADTDSIQIEAYKELAASAAKARSDMDAASMELLASGEKYNEAVFAAMVRFVNEIDDEIRSEVDQFNVIQTSQSEN